VLPGPPAVYLSVHPSCLAVRHKKNLKLMNYVEPEIKSRSIPTAVNASLLPKFHSGIRLI
jgi:hypothetical protein